MIGTSHKALSQECQDAHGCASFTQVLGGEAFAAVVSDGAGSARAGARGAAIITSILLSKAGHWLNSGNRVSSLDRNEFASWIDDVRELILFEAEASKSELRDYAATMLFALADSRSAVFAQVGDGALVTSDASSEWSAQFWPQHGDYANQTFFVTDDTVHERMSFGHSLYPVEEVAVFTDGLERVLLDFGERKAHAPAFEKMLAPLRKGNDAGHVQELSRALASYLGSTAIGGRLDDDLTLVIATRRPLMI